MKILETEGNLKLRIGDGNLHEDSSDNGVRVANSKNLLVKSTVFLHQSIYKYTSTTADGKTHNRDWSCIDRQEMAFKYTGFMTLSGDCKSNGKASTQAVQMFEVERFNRKKLSELDVMKQYYIEIWNTFAALENLNCNGDINEDWENIKDNIKISAKGSLVLFEWKEHKPRFDDECLQFLDQSKQAKMQWLQEPNQNKVEILKYEICN